MLFLTGCPWLIEPYVWVEPEVDVAKKTLLIVPFSDSKNTYCGSEDGNLLAQLISRQVRERSERTRIVDVDELGRLFTGRELESVGWKTVGQTLAADYVLVGHIESFTLKDSPESNLYVGTLKLTLKVVDTEDGAAVWSASPPDSSYRWTGAGDPDHGIPIFDVSEEEVRLNTCRLAARRVADVFCPRRMSRAQHERYRRQQRRGESILEE